MLAVNLVGGISVGSGQGQSDQPLGLGRSLTPGVLLTGEMTGTLPRKKGPPKTGHSVFSESAAILGSLDGEGGQVGRRSEI